MSVRKFSIGDSDEDDIESEPSTTSRFGLLRIRDDIEEEENKENVEEMSTSAVMSSTSLLEENPEVESLDSGEILADIRIKPEINEDPESEEFQSKKRTASPTFDPLLPGPSGHVQSACADILSDMKCFKRIEPIEEQKNDKREESSSEDNVPSVLPVSPIAVEDSSSNMRCVMNESIFKIHEKKLEEFVLSFPLSEAVDSSQSSPEILESDIICTKKIEPVITIETERWTSSSPCSSFSSEHSSFERIEPVKEDVKKFIHVKKSETGRWNSSSSCSSFSSDHSSFERIETVKEDVKKFLHIKKSRKRKNKCSSSVLQSATISSSMRNTSEASSIHDLKTESDEESLDEVESGRKHKKIKLEEIAPGYDLPGTSISSSRSCESIETDVKGLEEPKSVEKRKRKTKCTSLILPLTTISSSMQNTSEGSSVHEHKTESDEGSLEELESGRKHKKSNLMKLLQDLIYPALVFYLQVLVKKPE